MKQFPAMFCATPRMNKAAIDVRIIDKRLEQLLARMEQVGNEVRAKWPHQTEEEIQALVDTNIAYLDAVWRYNRQAPSIAAKYGLRNNGADGEQL